MWRFQIDDNLYELGGKLERELPFDKIHKISGRVPEILYFNRGRNIIFITIKMIFRKRKRPMRRGSLKGEPLGFPFEER